MVMTGTADTDLVYINEAFHTEAITPRQLDLLLADGWRHFGTNFFRYNFGYAGTGEEPRKVIPLRIRLADFRFSKNHRRIFKRNADTTTIIRPTEITEQSEALYAAHRTRFDAHQPTSIFYFLSNDPANVPTEGREVAVYLGDELIASSYFSVGHDLISSVIATFDPRMPSRSLGIFTILKEIEHAREIGKTFYYHGYAYEGESFYDYKKRFSALERFDWDANWLPF